MFDDLLIYERKPDYKRYWVGALIGAVGSLGAGIAGNAMNANQASINHKRQYKYANMLMKDQYRLNEQNYVKYQSPEALMRQYKEAGLNPNLIYGQASAPQGPAPVGSQHMNFDNFRYNSDFINQAISNYVNYLDSESKRNVNSAQTNNYNADTEKKSAEKNNIEANTAGIVLDNEQKAYYNSRQADIIDASISQKNAEIAYKAELMESQKIQNQLDRYFGWFERKQALENAKKQGNLTDAEIKKIDKVVEQIDAEMKLVPYRMRSLAASASQAFSQSSLNTALYQGQIALNQWNDLVRDAQRPYLKDNARIDNEQRAAELRGTSERNNQAYDENVRREIDQSLNPYGHSMPGALMNFVHRSLNYRTINKGVKSISRYAIY